MSVINTNVKSLVAQQSLSVNERKMSTTMERLSTGNRINSASDDAAGLAISSRMDSQIRGLSMAMRNSNDGISLLQTAEGAMSEVTSMLQRMRELSVQSINGVNNDSDRAALDAEVQQLVAEIDRIATTTQFNGINLVDGSFGKKTLQIGNLANQTMAIGMQDVRSTALGSDSAAAITAQGQKAALATTPAAATGILNAQTALVTTTSTAKTLSSGDLVINNVSVGSTLANDDALSAFGKAASAISKVTAINRVSDQTGVEATVGKTIFEGSAMTAAAKTGTLSINGVFTDSITTTDDAGVSRELVAQAINKISNQTGVRAVDTGSSDGGLQLIADDGRNIAVGFEQTQATGAAMTQAALTGKITINSVDTASITTTGVAASDRTLVVNAINAIADQTGVRAVDTGADSSGIKLITNGSTLPTVTLDTLTEAATGIDDDGALAASPLTAATTGLGAAGIQTGTYNLASVNGGPINISSETAAPTTLAKAGLVGGTFASGEASFTAKARAVASAAPATANAGVLELGDLSINGVTIAAALAADDTASHTSHVSSTKSASAIAIAAAINKSSSATGVTAKANANVIVGTGFTAGDDAMTLNGVTLTVGSSTETREDAADRINRFSGRTGVVAEDNGAGLTFTAADGRNITLVGAGIAASGLTGGGVATGETQYASVSLSSASAFTVDRASNSNANLTALGFSAGTFGGDGVGGRLSDVSVATAATATQAIGVLDNAIQTVSTARSDLGAKQNRLEFTVNNLSTMVTNTSASQSRIRDTDYAVETTNLARSQIIQQAATAMLAQANQQPSGVLALLQ